MMPGGAAEPVGVGDRDPDDLAEAEGDDREVVAADPQGRRAQDHAGHHGDRDRDRQRQEERPVPVLRGQHAGGVGADRRRSRRTRGRAGRRTRSRC